MSLRQRFLVIWVLHSLWRHLLRLHFNSIVTHWVRFSVSWVIVFLSLIQLINVSVNLNVLRFTATFCEEFDWYVCARLIIFNNLRNTLSPQVSILELNIFICHGCWLWSRFAQEVLILIFVKEFRSWNIVIIPARGSILTFNCGLDLFHSTCSGRFFTKRMWLFTGHFIIFWSRRNPVYRAFFLTGRSRPLTFIWISTCDFYWLRSKIVWETKSSVFILYRRLSFESWMRYKTKNSLLQHTR